MTQQNDLKNGWVRYMFAMLSFMKPLLDLRKSERATEYREAFGNILFDRDGSTVVSEPSTSTDQYYAILWSGFIEISETFDVLRDIPEYMRRFPVKTLGLSKLRFLRYHITNYFNEVYILEQRLKAYQTRIYRACKKDPRLINMEDDRKQLELMLSGFEGIRKTRGLHVHRERFTDKQLERLGLLELLASHGEPGVSAMLYKHAIRDSRKKWLKILYENNAAMEQTMDVYFSILYSTVFDKKGQIIVPFAIT